MSPHAISLRIHQVFELELFYRRVISQFKPVESTPKPSPSQPTKDS
ncbi:MAG: hypothetical protein SFY68_07580 [Candidatus Sumerlaeia bacterium]|nr:hypothetical protein [Candidatus Sumerlaeia bacterium]